MINNIYGSPTSILYQLTPTVSPGGQIQDKPSNLIWNNVVPGMYNQFTINILGTNLSSINILDPNITIMIIISKCSDNV